jgi:hypothetical protein
MNFVCDGREAVRQNLGHWVTAMAGMLVKASVYKEFVKEIYYKGVNTAYGDEVEHLRLLYRCDKVAIADASYYYRMVQSSVIHKVSVNRFNELTAAQLLYEFAGAHYGEEKKVMNAVLADYLNKTYRCALLYIAHRKDFNSEERSFICGKIHEAYRIASKCPVSSLTLKSRLLRTSYPLFWMTTYCIYQLLKRRKLA